MCVRASRLSLPAVRWGVAGVGLCLFVAIAAVLVLSIIHAGEASSLHGIISRNEPPSLPAKRSAGNHGCREGARWRQSATRD
jgi:hypothetical protein